MKISLRKANAFQVAINEVLKGLEFRTDIGINEFQDPDKEIDAALAKFNANVNRRWNLISALYDIRTRVAAENADPINNINGMLADLARLEKDIVFFSQCAKAATLRTDLRVMQGKLAKLAARVEDSYYAKAEVETSIFTEGDLEIIRNNLSDAKKNKQALQDRLLEVNVRSTIELATSTVEVLRAEDIL